MPKKVSSIEWKPRTGGKSGAYKPFVIHCAEALKKGEAEEWDTLRRSFARDNSALAEKIPTQSEFKEKTLSDGKTKVPEVPNAFYNHVRKHGEGIRVRPDKGGTYWVYKPE